MSLGRYHPFRAFQGLLGILRSPTRWLAGKWGLRDPHPRRKRVDRGKRRKKARRTTKKRARRKTGRFS